MWDLWRHKSDTKVFLDKSVGGEYNFFGQLWRVCVFLCFWDLWSFCEDRFDGLDNSCWDMVKFWTPLGSLSAPFFLSLDLDLLVLQFLPLGNQANSPGKQADNHEDKQ